MKDARLLSEKFIKKSMKKFMNPKFLKFYFWLLFLGTIATPAYIVKDGYQHVIAYSTDTIYCLVNAIALYVFIYNKKFLSFVYWKILFWLDFIYQIAYMAYQFAPNAILIKYLSILSTNGKPDDWFGFALNIFLAIPLLYVIFQLSKGRFLSILKKDSIKNKDNVLQNQNFQWGRFISVALLAEINVIAIYLLLIGYKVIADSQIAYSNYAAVSIAVALPFVIYILKLHQRQLKVNLLSLKFAGILVICLFFAFAFEPQQPQQKQQEIVAVEPFSSDDLMNAVNKKRKENKVNLLQVDESTCMLAKVRVDQFSQYGASIYGNKASLDRAYDRAFNSYKGNTLDWYYDYLTYESTIEDTIKKWSGTSDKSIFKNKKFKYGCAAVENGYGVVVVGYNEPTPTPAKPLPSGVDPASLNFN